MTVLILSFFSTGMASNIYTLVLKPRSVIEQEKKQMEMDRLLALLLARELNREEEDVVDLSQEEEEEDQMKIRMEAERYRCEAIRQSHGKLIIHDRYYDQDNPYWVYKARKHLYGKESPEMGTTSPREGAEVLPTCHTVNHVSNYIGSLPFTANNQRNTHMTHLKAQQRVNAAQNYARFGGQKGRVHKKK